MQGHLDRISWM